MLAVTRICSEDTATGVKLSARLVCPGTPLEGREVWFSYPGEYSTYLSSSANPWVAALLWPAMRLGQDLRLEAPVSPRLLEATETLMSIMHQWDRRFKRIQIEAEPDSAADEAGRTVASFFSGGVDSFHTVLKHTSAGVCSERRVSHLIFARGFDIDLYDDALYELVLRRIRESASDLGCSLVVCSTNIRNVLPDEIVGWQMYHGAAMAAIALGAERLWNRVFFPGPETYDRLVPDGCHPLLDPLWSTEALAIVHDGAEATRIEKIRDWIAKSDVALRHLRVCWENRDGDYNCGKCEKCVRTMVNLELTGVLGKCRSFARPLCYRDVAHVRFRGEGQHALMVQNYEAALASNTDPRLIRALKRCLYPSLVSKATRGLRRRIKSLTPRLSHNGHHGGSGRCQGNESARMRYLEQTTRWI